MKVFVSKLKSLRLTAWHYLTLFPRNTWIGAILIVCGVASLTDSVRDSQWYRSSEVQTTNESIQNSVNNVVTVTERHWKNAQENQKTTELFFYETLRSELDDFYKWLHKRQLNFRTKIYDVIALLPATVTDISKHEDVLQKIGRRIDTFQALDFSKLSFEREMEVQRRLRSISVLSYALFQYIKASDKKMINTPKNLSLSFEPVRTKLTGQRIAFDSSNEEISFNWRSVGVGLMLLFLGIYTIRRQEADSEYVRHLETVTKAEGPEFINTKPVNHYLLDLYRKHYNDFNYVACVIDEEYQVHWMNSFGKRNEVTDNDLQMSIQNSFLDKNDRATIVLNQDIYHVFHSEIPVDNYYADIDLSKNYTFVQLIPATVDVLEFNTIVTPAEFKTMNNRFKEKHASFMINDTFSDLLAKMNFVFQVNGTIVDFNPLESDIPCAFNVDEFDEFMVGYLKQLGRVVQQYDKIGKVYFSLVENSGRIYFTTFIPEMHFSENWSEESDLIAERDFIEKLSHIQTKMTSHLLRTSVRNRTIAGHNGAEIVVAFENPVFNEVTV